SSQVLAVEEFHCFTPTRSVRALQRRGASSGPGETLALFIGGFAAQRIALESSFKVLIVLALLPLRRHRKMEATVLEIDAGERPRAAKSAYVGADQRPVAGQTNLQPGWVFPLRRSHSEIPAPEERRLGPLGLFVSADSRDE